MLLHALLAVCSIGALQDAPRQAQSELPIVATWSIDRPAPFVGELLSVEFVVEGPTEFLANEIVPRTLRRLGRAIEFDTGLRSEGAALLEVVAFEEASEWLTCVVDGAVVRGERIELADGRERFAVRFDGRAVAAGLVRPAPRLVFAVRRARAVGVFGAEVASDYELHEILVDAPAVEVRALPVEAEELAVGAFEMVGDAPPVARVAVGERIALVVRVRGAENRAQLDAPRLESGGALHVLGGLRSEEPGSAEVVFTFECEVIAEPTSPCEFVLATFDPTGAGRVVVHRAPFALAIDGPDVAHEPRVVGATQADDSPDFGTRAVAALGIGAFLAALAIVVARRRRSAARVPDPRVAAAHAARAAALERGDAGAALAAFVETLFRVPVAARNGAALRGHLTRSGVPPELAARVAERVDAALHARYGGRGDTSDASHTDDLCAELERVTRTDPRNER